MGATPKEEIDRQHREAINIVENKLECMPMTLKGEIPLEWKTIPTVENPFYISINTVNTRMSDGGGDDSMNSDADAHADAPSLCTEDGYDETKEGSAERSTCDPQYTLGSCVATRGIINADKIASCIEEGCHSPPPPSSSSSAQSKKSKQKVSETNLWHMENAKKFNVHITRPSHDNWGIRKIILLFCDDFLQNVYEMPYFHLPKYKELQESLEPIYDTLNVRPDRIVRMLFAALPPGVTIPIHHDTGEWVKHTHRIHVPIIVPNPDHILFRCGPTEQSLQRVSCTPGHIFEMNNQAKHAVSNCSTTNRYRVHLILDYVDADFRKMSRIQLRPGETIIQTRRSIDRAIDAGSRQSPSFMIIGVQKSGTTSLYEYMNQHPLIIRAKRRETHCFDWRWDTKLKTREEQKEHCLSFFFAKELYKHPSLLTGDSTPSYLLDSYRVIPRIKKVFYHQRHWNKISFIVMLRNPTKRVKSHYEMVTSLDGTEAQIKTRGTEWLNKTIEDVIELDFMNMKNCGLIPYWDIDSKTVNMDIFHSFVGSEEEDDAFISYLKQFVPMNTGSHSILVRGLYELQLRQWMKVFDEKQFLVLKLEDMCVGVQHTMNKVWKHLSLPPFKIEDEEAKNTRTYKNELQQDTKDMLDRFYKPHNERLSLVLSGEEWSNNSW
mmetsp:Transcript_1663/g.2376  ORF Transcript_1663/g.2376 Transcript_1663/m.2376 type:complete len:662 (+) Transcript_1663:150-2135(+)